MSNILEENPNRFVLFPIQHHDIWNFYKKSQASFWTAEEIDLSDDLADYENLEEGEKHFINNAKYNFYRNKQYLKITKLQRKLCS